MTNAASGLTLTDGTAITLSLDGAGRIIGTVAAGDAEPADRQDGVCDCDRSGDGRGVCGAVSVAASATAPTNTPNDSVTLAAGSVGVTVTLTDGDGDQVTSAATDISSHDQLPGRRPDGADGDGERGDGWC